jgi:hypothetical protein
MLLHYPHGGRPQPGEGARAAHGPPTDAHAAAAEGSTATEGETLKELAKSYNVGKSTISRLAQWTLVSECVEIRTEGPQWVASGPTPAAFDCRDDRLLKHIE